MTRYRLHAIRLINFHNFVDETIEVRDGGHLFMLGDNGSGKTTVLDAVHYVLAGGELELNAAARLGGKRDDGRTLQGIVLRYDFERGVRNEGGAIAYAAIELVDGAGKRLSLGIGTEATTLDARVSKWGFVVPRPLAEIELVDLASQPFGRDGLRRQLGPNHVFTPLAGYRKELARRLFGSERQYDDAVRFWGMAKAYREIVAGARDFGALFERLLPAPDTEVFGEILRTLRAIDDLELALRDLDGQAGYVRGLVGLAGEVATGREAAARYRWLACAREVDEIAAAAGRETDAAARWRDEAVRLGAEAETARLRSERADQALRVAEAEDAAGVLGELRAAETRRGELGADADRLAGDARAAARDRDGVTRLALERRGVLAAVAAGTDRALRDGADELGELPGDLGAVRRFADEVVQLADATTALTAVPDARAAADAAAAVLDRSRTLAAGTRIAARDAGAVRDAAAATLAELERSTEAEPAIEGYPTGRRALADAGIAARPVYELVEPAVDADPHELAAIEALAGEDVLAAVVVAESDRARARGILAATAPALRVVVAIDAAAELPAWCATALGATGDAPGARVLAAALAQGTALGPVAAPAGGDVALRGLGFRVAADAPRLLGREARRRAHAADVARARETAADAARRADAAARAAGAADNTVERAQRLVRSIADAAGELAAAWHTAHAAEHRVDLAHQVVVDADRRAHDAAARVAAVDVDLSALRGRIDGVDLDELERRLVALRAACATARTRWHAQVEAQLGAKAEARAAEDRAAAAAARTRVLGSELAAAAETLRAALAALASPVATTDDAGLAHYVRVTQRGDSFRSLETLRQRIVEVERTADAAADELERDGSRGVRCLTHAARFGFVYDRSRNHVEDRRGQPIAGVLAELDRAIAEQRSVVNERTRTLMDTLVMGELARHLQGQVHHLSETIKGINRVLRGLKFGPSEYQFQATPRDDRAELIELVRKLSILDEDSRHQFRAWIDARLDELRAADDDAVPVLLDYRRWFEFKLRMSTTDAEGVELTHRLRQVGSGGEQGVPNYLLVLALAKLMFDAAGAAVRPLLFDEAFYGIDAGRRDQLLRLATDLGLQLCVASPDQDGTTASVHAATTLFVIKDANHDVHLAPYHFWNRARAPQSDLFAAAAAPGAAECRTP
jgi:hypothetical protein